MSVSDVPATVAGRTADVRALSEQLPRFLRLAHAFKHTIATEGRDRAALVLLHPLVRLGRSGRPRWPTSSTPTPPR